MNMPYRTDEHDSVCGIWDLFIQSKEAGSAVR